MEAAYSLAIALGIVGLVAFIVSRNPRFRRDSRRDMALAVMSVSLITTFLSLQVVSAALRFAAAVPTEHFNGLLLSGIVLLLISALTFLFALAVLLSNFVRFDRLPRSKAADPDEDADVLIRAFRD